MTNTPTIIIGAGPGGASAAIYLARFCHPVLLFDAPEEVHGRTFMAPDINNFLGETTPPTGPNFIERINNQLKNYPQIERRTEKVTKVVRSEDGFKVTTTQGNYTAPHVILAIGLSDNMPPINGLDPYYDHAIFHCLTCDWYERRDKKIAVIANTDRGISTALMLNHLHRPPRLVVIPGQDGFDFSSAMRDQAKAADITVYESPIKELIGADGYLHSVKLADGTAVEVEVLFTKLGHQRFDQFLDAGAIEVERDPDEGFIKVDWRTVETSVKNLFAVGPCNNGPDQIIIAGGQGAMAALEIHTRLLAAQGL